MTARRYTERIEFRASPGTSDAIDERALLGETQSDTRRRMTREWLALPVPDAQAEERV